jgi:hydroxyacylglutathione hydrolase
MATLEVHRVPVLHDNYVWLAHEPSANATAAVDPAVAGPVLEALASKGWTLTHILNTHHHNDHTGGNLELKAKTGCTIVGSRTDRDRIPGIDVEVGDGDTYDLGDARAQVFDVSGHTLGHIAYWFADSDTLFCGDTMFAMGCGRVIEGEFGQMLGSLEKLKALPGATKIYCAHEYTQKNGQFALTVEPENPDLIARMRDVDAKRARNIATVPSTLAEEWKTNPFLRPDSRHLQETIGLAGASLVEVFAETRKRKDAF